MAHFVLALNAYRSKQNPPNDNSAATLSRHTTTFSILSRTNNCKFVQSTGALSSYEHLAAADRKTMSEPEKMEAIKRAYAEMILNTAKEAAARVMAAELRSRRLEHDLVSTKDEAARMLLYLKQSIDTKTKEVDITSLNQKNKIHELESQLNEAEGIIIDLRAELNSVHEQLDETKNKNLHVSTRVENTEILERGILNRDFPYQSKHSAKVNLDLAKSNVVTNSTGIENVNAVSGSQAVEERAECGENEGISIVRRSSRKRKVKFLDDFITVCGLRKKCVKSGESRIKPEDGT
ncbi:organellar single-stranded DNA binding protein 3 [Striga asiatica]|uniref:Organellar single-stranded DNA binding protein 3 n=1 Tax=Striga asiatica TaxID=4170 RepID=A0A5A7P996_STRAF|nr:organellar single-stranded DNA binding protein 3 [Striga asiatica]